jgi:hypothetical protein
MWKWLKTPEVIKKRKQFTGRISLSKNLHFILGMSRYPQIGAYPNCVLAFYKLVSHALMWLAAYVY